MVDVSQQLDYSIDKCLTGQKKYVYFGPMAPITQFNGQHQIFQISTDTNAINFGRMRLQLKFTILNAGDAGDFIYRKAISAIKRLTIKSGNDEKIFQLTEYPHLYANGRQLMLNRKNDENKQEYMNSKKGIITSIPNPITQDDDLAQFNIARDIGVPNQQGVGGIVDVQLSIPFSELGVPDKFISLQTSVCYIHIEYHDLATFIPKIDVAGTALQAAQNQTVRNGQIQSQLYVEQQWLPDVNMLIKKQMLENEFPLEFVTSYLFTLPEGNNSTNITVSRGNGQLIKGVLISFPSADINANDVNKLFDTTTVSDSGLTKLEITYDSQLIDNIQDTKYCKQVVRGNGQHQFMNQYWFDLGYQFEKESGYPFGDGQAYNLLINTTSTLANLKMVVHVVGQKYLKQAPGDVKVL